MRKTVAFLIATTAIAAPAWAQNTTDTASNSVAANDAAMAPAPADPDNLAATDPLATNVVANDPVVSPEAGGAVDTSYGEPAAPAKKGFPWGVLGLLGLLGLIPRKPRERRHDGAI
ncbi:MAG TPA: hypothetical protein VM165_03960 [Planctomycetaceae bacterium]|nr:hypothetical protein [Planctomycetaceae bacterium]